MIVESVVVGVVVVTVASLHYASRMVASERSVRLLRDAGGDVDVLARRVDEHRARFQAAAKGSGTERLERERLNLAMKELEAAIRAAKKR